MSRTKLFLAVICLAVVATACPPETGGGGSPAVFHEGRCVGNEGVTIVVDYVTFRNEVKVRCALGSQGNGFAVLDAAGFAHDPGHYPGTVCQLDGLPTQGHPYCWTTGGYWSYWKSATAGGPWVYSEWGAAAGSSPQLGSVEGWRFAPFASGPAVAPRVGTSGPVTPGPTAAAAALDRAGDWVLSQFNATGYLPSVWDPTVSETGNGVLGVANLAVLGKGAGSAATRLSYLASEFEDYVDFGDGPRPGALARVIMAVVAGGGNPRSFGGTDLVARLEGTLQGNGLFGTQSAQFDGAFRQGLALAALSIVTPRPASITPAPGQTVEQLPAVAWLLAQQCDDGSWLMFRASTVGDCVENPATWTFKDSNGSALATLGLSAVGATAHVDPASWFNAVRGTEGGWGASPAGPTQTSDADSTGLIIAALESLSATVPTSAYDALLSFQLGASAPAVDRGAFVWRHSATETNRLATMDAMTALFDEVWPGALRP